MTNLTWISAEAQNLHAIFVSLFYALVTCLLLLGVFVEYFKWPLGGVPSFAVLVGRALVATLLLHSYGEIVNTLSQVMESLANAVGDISRFDQVLSKMADKLGEYSGSWVSIKETSMVILCFLGFFALYFSLYITEGIHLFAWTLSYVFSPILIALFVLPATASATKALFRTVFEVSCWKVVWASLSTLLWTSALSEINKPSADIAFFSVICMNLMLAGSILLTPMVVHTLATTGLAGFTRTVGSVAVGTSVFGPKAAFKAMRHTYRRGRRIYSRRNSPRKGSSNSEDESTED